jgi:hypothetical protein
MISYDIAWRRVEAQNKVKNKVLSLCFLLVFGVN